MRLVPLILLLLLVFGVDGRISGEGATPAPNVSFEVKTTGTPLQRELIVRLQDQKSGTPVTGVVVALDVDMPSMPMMHNVPRTQAPATSRAGEYAARVSLEMPGEWAAKIVVGDPGRVIATRKFVVTEGTNSTPPAAKGHQH